jgi:hypothetical protein
MTASKGKQPTSTKYEHDQNLFAAMAPLLRYPMARSNGLSFAYEVTLDWHEKDQHLLEIRIYKGIRICWGIRIKAVIFNVVAN